MNYMTKMSGFFAVGTLATTLLAGIAAKFISVQIHAGVISAISVLLLFYIVKELNVILFPANKSDAARDAVRFAQFFTSFKIDWVVNLGLLFGFFLSWLIYVWHSSTLRSLYSKTESNVCLSFLDPAVQYCSRKSDDLALFRFLFCFFLCLVSVGSM